MKKISTQELIEKIEKIRARIVLNREHLKTETFPLHGNYAYAAKNLIDYLSLRTFDFRVKQANHFLDIPLILLVLLLIIAAFLGDLTG
jgi:hypothetical protein